MTDARLTAFLEAALSGDRARTEELAQQMTSEERNQVDQLHAVVQLARLQRAGGQVQ